MKTKVASITSFAYQYVCHGIFCLLAIICMALLSACSKRFSEYPVYHPLAWYDEGYTGVGRFKTTHLVEQIDEYYRGTNPGPIAVATFVNIDDLYTTSTFGRMVAEQLMSELAMRGFDVVELRHSEALQFLASDGEFALSRDVGMVRRQRDLGGILVGTYTASPIRVYLNARLVNPSNSLVVAAGTVEMEKTREIARMLRGGAFPATLERIPVRHLGQTTVPMAWSPYPTQMQQWEAEERSMGTGNLPPSSSGVLPPAALPPAPEQKKMLPPK